ncbi:MAG: hypothetical protein ACRDJW_12440 [Thermomicrobiales bacterium]
MNDIALWDHLATIDTADADGAGESRAAVTDGSRIYGPPAVVRRLLHRMRAAGIMRCHDPLKAADCASDKELHRLAGPLGRLHVEDVRWDLIGAAHGGQRHRI